MIIILQFILLLKFAAARVEAQDAHVFALFQVENDEVNAIRHIVLLNVDIAHLQRIKLMLFLLRNELLAKFRCAQRSTHFTFYNFL